MWFRTLFDTLTPRRNPSRTRRAAARPPTCRLSVEVLEDRLTPTAMLTIGDVAILEGNAGAQNALVTVSLTEPHGNSVTVNYSTANGTASAGSDYNSVSGKLTFTKSEMSKTILVPVRGDRVVEPNEHFFVQLSNAKGAKIADGQGVVTIVEDDPQISIADAYNYGDSTPFTFTVSLSAASAEWVTVDFTTVDGTALAGGDYVLTSGTLRFEPGVTTMTFTVDVLDPTYADNKYFTVQLSGATPNALILDGSATGSWYYYDYGYYDGGYYGYDPGYWDYGYGWW